MDKRMEIANTTCDNCGIQFYKKPAEKSRTLADFCSRKCSGQKRAESTVKWFFRRTKKDENGCWIWQGSLNAFGYGTSRFRGRSLPAHRIAWEIHHGPIPNGEHVLHRCDNPPCVNPNHLFLGTHQDNMDDMARKGRKSTRLSLGQVAEIRRSQESSEHLAARFGVAARTIRYARNPNHWIPAPPISERSAGE